MLHTLISLFKFSIADKLSSSQKADSDLNELKNTLIKVVCNTLMTNK